MSRLPDVNGGTSAEGHLGRLKAMQRLTLHFCRSTQQTLQAKALESVLKDVNQRFGKGSIMKMSGVQTKV